MSIRTYPDTSSAPLPPPLPPLPPPSTAALAPPAVDLPEVLLPPLPPPPPPSLDRTMTPAASMASTAEALAGSLQNSATAVATTGPMPPIRACSFSFYLYFEYQGLKENIAVPRR